MEIEVVTAKKVPGNKEDFLQTFFAHREINREFYQRVPEDKFDFRLEPTGGIEPPTYALPRRCSTN